MNIAQLIEELKKYPPETDVEVWATWGEDWRDLNLREITPSSSYSINNRTYTDPAVVRLKA